MGTPSTPGSSPGAGPGAGPSLAGWFVTARHRQTGSHGDPRPWGAVHVKRIGEPRTACGVVSLGWQVFWGAPAASFLPDLCAACREVALEEDHGPGRGCRAC